MSERRVGPVLLACSLTHALVRVICDGNPHAVADHRGARGAYVRILSPPPCVLRRADVEELLGRSFDFTRDLEPAMPSFRGRIEFREQEVRWV
jgi:hypothetical protein